MLCDGDESDDCGCVPASGQVCAVGPGTSAVVVLAGTGVTLVPVPRY